MRRWMVALFIVMAWAIFAQDSPKVLQNSAVSEGSATLPRYRVVKGWPVKDAIPAVNSAAEQGYRILFTSQLTIMRRDAEPPDTFRYMIVPDTGLLSSFMNDLNQQGAFGYRWRSRTRFLEKEPHPHNYEYEIVHGIKMKTRDDSRDSLREQGYLPIGTFANQQVFIRELGRTSAERRGQPARFVEMSPEKRAMKQIAELARAGYRYGSTEISLKGIRQIHMEKCDDPCDSTFEYRKIKIESSPDQLERDLNTMANDGFRVVPDSFDWHWHLMERGTNHARRFAYRVGGADEEAATEQFVNAGDRDGFIPVAFAAHVGWKVHAYIILEKPLGAD